MAFVSSFTPALTSSSALRQTISKCTATSKVSMSTGKSPAMPFVEAPEALSADIPGYVGFDPLNFSSFFDVNYLREAEIKHGRICMLAIMGFMVAEFYTFPFYTGAPHVVALRHDWAVQQGSLQQILLWCAFFEAVSYPAFHKMWVGESDRVPGDFSFDPMGLGKDAVKMAKFQVNEIKNGRLAMIAVGGAVHQALLTNQNMFEQLTAGNFVLPQ